ncbi:MAG TPA: hypothetical protein VEW28_07690 [Candidatus Kapabacteria bacterium]|nr:hypothetical protein [Candidatus Kapabacteria bacterium]
MDRFIYNLTRSIAVLLLVIVSSANAFAALDQYLRISDSRGNVVATVRCSEGKCSAGELKSGTYHVSVVDVTGKQVAFNGTLTYEITAPGITINAEGGCKHTGKPNSITVNIASEKQTAANEFIVIEDGSSVSFTCNPKPPYDSTLQAMQTTK